MYLLYNVTHVIDNLVKCCFALLLQIEEANSCDALDSVVDEPQNISILNSSSWNVVEAVTIENKASLVQRLIDEEVVIKRERNLKAFRKGLETLGLLHLLTSYPSLMKPYFVMECNPLTPAKFFSLVKYCFPKTDIETQALDFFKEFVTALHGMLWDKQCITVHAIILELIIN